MPLGNIVMLDPDVPERMHFTDHTIVSRDITDPTTGRPATRKVLEFSVDRMNGQPAAAKFSTMAETLYSQLEPFLSGQVYRQYEFIITKRGGGYRTRYTVDRIPSSG
jgi:hypothetical protein